MSHHSEKPGPKIRTAHARSARIARLLTRTFKGRIFFLGLMSFFVAESLWIAFSAAYPQAFDEDFHFGIIQIYAHHWLPFLSTQPANADQFGGVAHDPSYLYHYLMSFPYRIIAAFLHGQMSQVIALRLINIALFGLGIVLFRRVLLRAGISAALTNVSLFVLIFIPIVPQLAAQINYDNLLMPIVAWMCLMVFDLTRAVREGLPFLRTLAVMLCIGLLGCLVKFPFLPIFAACVLFVGYVTIRTFRGHFADLLALIRADFAALKRRTKLLLLAILLVSAGLFSQRYVVNIVEYGEPVPDCAAVLSVQRCQAYSPWARNYNDSLNRQQPASVAIYMGEWLYGLWFRLFFAINGPTSGYQNYPSLPLPSAAAIVLALFGVAVLGQFWRQTFRRNDYLAFFLLVIVCYCGALWLDDYAQYLKTGQPVAINGRYLLPVLLPMAAIIGRAISVSMRTRPLLKPLLAAAVIVLFLEGGGVLTFISRSDESWYWPSKVVVQANRTARRLVSPILIESGNKFY